jgi:hypothetical protein
MSMKVIQVPMEERLLSAITRSAKARKSTRAALIREACKRYMDRLEEEELDRRYIEGYRRQPERPAWGKLGEKLALEVWAKEEWDEAR